MNNHRMSEAEVSLRLAIHLVSTKRAASDVQVALDGAQVKLGAVRHFDVASFLHALGWKAEDASERWQAKYVHPSMAHGINVHSKSGTGDVTAVLADGRSLVVEAKKGTLENCSRSSEYPLLREALGQLLTLAVVPENAVLAVAIPHGERLAKLADRWRSAPLVRASGIRFLTVAPSGDVKGWEL